MKFAIFGDIHANIYALQAAYEAALSIGVEKIYHTGDLGGYSPFVNEVVDFLIEHKIKGVQGNYDEAVANDKEHCGCKYEDAVQAVMSEMAFKWTKENASTKTKDYLRALPEELSFRAGDKTVKIFHATPLKNNLYWYEDRSEKFYLDMAWRAAADVIIYGHTHIPYRRDLARKVFINAGSVGKPKDGDTRACIAIVEIKDEDIETSTVSVSDPSQQVKTEFLRISYDFERAASAIIASGLPAYFAERLRIAS